MTTLVVKYTRCDKKKNDATKKQPPEKVHQTRITALAIYHSGNEK